MNDWLDLLNFGLNSAMLALTALGVGGAAIMPGTDRWNRRFFMSLFASIMLCLAAAHLDVLVYKNPSLATAEKIAAYFEYLFLPLPMPIFTAYLLHTCGERWQRSAIFRAVLAIFGVYFLLLGIAQCTTFLYTVTPDNQFVRGPWHSLLMAFMILPMLLNLAGVVRRRNRLPKKYYGSFLVYPLSLTVALIVHTFFFSPTLVFIGVVVSAFAMFAIVLRDQIDRYMRQQREIAHQRASIMVLEMRPHFIYNAMMSIYYLCAQDPKKAQQVTLDFTTYLRKNFTAIASEDTVPFSDELEHTRAYLAVEQVQFEDGLFVEYDTPHKEFRVPPLTLQPIVENAVKHGMDPENAPLRISIRTRETESGSEIIVEDNGPGFDPTATDDNEPHIALANIRQRLEMMCGGKLAIQPREGGGTAVKVTIPYDAQKGGHSASGKRFFNQLLMVMG